MQVVLETRASRVSPYKEVSLTPFTPGCFIRKDFNQMDTWSQTFLWLDEFKSDRD